MMGTTGAVKIVEQLLSMGQGSCFEYLKQNKDNLQITDRSEQDIYSGVNEKDFKAIDATFKGLLSEVLPLTAGYPELEDLFADFITKVGMQSQTILQKYANDNHVKGLEVEDYKNKLFEMKQQIVRIEMKMLPLSKVCNKIMNDINSTKEKK